MPTRNAHANWNGNLEEGSGTVSFGNAGVDIELDAQLR